VTTAEMLRAEGEARSEARWRAEALVEMLTVKFGDGAWQITYEHESVPFCMDDFRAATDLEP